MYFDAHQIFNVKVLHWWQNIAIFLKLLLNYLLKYKKIMFNPMAEVNQHVGVQLSSVKAFMISII